MFNDPLNPAGTTAGEAELAMIAQLCLRHDLAVISDEVWEDVRFRRHRPPFADEPAGHGRASGEDRLGGEDLRRDRLENGFARHPNWRRSWAGRAA